MTIPTLDRTVVSTIDRAGIAALGTTVAIFAHPDDEAYIAAGLLAALRDLGHRVVCVTATRGDAGNGLHDDGAPAARAALAAVRTAELARALAILNIEEHHWLDYTDAALDSVPEEEAVGRLERVLAAVQPTTVLSFGPDGWTGHPDHQAVSRWAELAVARTHPRPQLLQAVTSQAVLDDGRDVNDSFPVFVWGTPRVVTEEEMALQLVLEGGELDRKVESLRVQYSQTDSLIDAIGVDRFARWVRVESFRRVYATAPLKSSLQCA